MHHNCSTHLSNVLDPHRPFFIFGLTGISILATTLNAVILYAFIKEKSVRTFSNCFFISLATSDILVGIVLSPVTVVQLILPKTEPNCIVNKVSKIASGLLAVTAFTVAAIAYDRFQHVAQEGNYQQFMSKKRKTILLAFPWIAPTIVTSIQFVQEETFIWMLVGAPTFVYVVLIGSYARLIILLRRRETEWIGCSPDETKRLTQRWKKNQKASKLIFLIIVLFIFCTLGRYTYYILQAIYQHTEGSNFFLRNQSVISATSQLLFQLNSVLNPLLYVAKHSEIKTAIKSLKCAPPKNRIMPADNLQPLDRNSFK